jgi:hypothetical protein
MGLGSLDDVSLAEAREKAATARKLHKQGEDPIKVRDAATLETWMNQLNSSCS